MDVVTEVAGRGLGEYGVLGIVVIGLVYYVLQLRSEMKALRDNHKVEIAAKDALINELQEARLREVRAGFDIAASNRAALEAFTIAMRGKG